MYHSVNYLDSIRISECRIRGECYTKCIMEWQWDHILKPYDTGGILWKMYGVVTDEIKWYGYGIGVEETSVFVLENE